MNEIVIEKLNMNYGKKQVLFDVSMEIEKGTIFGLIGPSGCGKTTLVKCIAGLLSPKIGSVMVSGIIMPSSEVISRMGYMSQAAALYPTLTGRENLQFFGKLYGLKGELLQKRISHVSALVKLTDELNMPVQQYSGGMKQRLSLAIALIHEPDVLLLDEPTVGIDPVLRHEIWDELKELSAKGVTILITTHVMDEAEKCGRLAMMREGRLLATGTAAEIIKETDAESFEDAFIRLGREVNHED